jgi:hypothetical protein
VRLAHARARARANGIVGAAVEVSVAGTSHVFSVAPAHAVEAMRDGLYRLETWLRTDTPGVGVCLRVEEVSPKGAATRWTSETCLDPTTTWEHFTVTRKTILEGDRLLFSLYSFNAVAHNTFELDGFAVDRFGPSGWVQVSGALRSPPKKPAGPGGLRDTLDR